MYIRSMQQMIKEKRRSRRPYSNVKRNRQPVLDFVFRNDIYYIFIRGNARPFEMKISNYGCKDF